MSAKVYVKDDNLTEDAAINSTLMADIHVTLGQPSMIEDKDTERTTSNWSREVVFKYPDGQSSNALLIPQCVLMRTGVSSKYASERVLLGVPAYVADKLKNKDGFNGKFDFLGQGYESDESYWWNLCNVAAKASVVKDADGNETPCPVRVSDGSQDVAYFHSVQEFFNEVPAEVNAVNVMCMMAISVSGKSQKGSTNEPKFWNVKPRILLMYVKEPVDVPEPKARSYNRSTPVVPVSGKKAKANSSFVEMMKKRMQ